MDSAGNSLAVGKRKFRIVSVAQLAKADWNYKKNDEELADKLAANLKRNGQVETLMVRQLGKNGRMEVVNGNHRLDALITLGLTKAVVCDLGKISKAEAMRLAIEVNETRFETDYVKLSGLFKEMKLEFDDADLLATLPFDERELSDISKITDFEWPALEKKARDVEEAARKGSKVQMVFNFSIKQANVLNNWFVRSGKDSREEAVMIAVEKQM